MPSITFARLRSLLLALCCVAPLAWVQAQNAPQPKANVPAYQVRPGSGIRPPQDTEAGSSGTGPRVWNVMKF